MYNVIQKRMLPSTAGRGVGGEAECTMLNVLVQRFKEGEKAV
jgi:hypothetical protein